MVKNAKIVYSLLAFSGSLLIVFICISLTINGNKILDNFYVYMLLIVIWMFIAFKITAQYTKKSSQKIENILLEECDPTRYIQVMEKSMTKMKFNDLETKTTILLKLSVAYMNLERKEASKSILDSITYFSDSKLGWNNRIYHANNVLHYYFYTQDLQNARLTFNKIKAMLKNDNQTDQKILALYQEDTFLLNIAEGNLEKAELFFDSIFNNAKSTYQKVHAKFCLGKIYCKDNKTEDAKNAFLYVVNHGNKLYCVQEAQQYINSVK